MSIDDEDEDDIDERENIGVYMEIASILSNEYNHSD